MRTPLFGGGDHAIIGLFPSFFEKPLFYETFFFFQNSFSLRPPSRLESEPKSPQEEEEETENFFYPLPTQERGKSKSFSPALTR